MPKYFKSASVRVKDKNGKYVMIPALRAPSGYEIAKEKGFTGTEEEWIELMIGDGWIGAFQTLEDETERLDEVKIDAADVVSIETKTALGLTEEATPAEAIAKMFDISSAHLSNRAPTENDAAAPGKVWMVPYMRFNNLMPNAPTLSLDDWTLTGAAGMVEADGITLTGDGTAATIEGVANMLGNVAKDHKVFISAKVTAVTAANSITLKLNGTSGAVVKTMTVDIPDASSEHVLNALFTSSEDIAQLVFSSAYNSAATQSGQGIKIERIIVLDLTNDMCQAQAGLEFTEEEAVTYTSRKELFQVAFYEESDNEWECHGLHNGKYVWTSEKDEASALTSYNALVTNANQNAVDAALGKNNEDRIRGIGKALAMYARFIDPTIDIDVDFADLIKCDRLDQISIT